MFGTRQSMHMHIQVYCTVYMLHGTCTSTAVHCNWKLPVTFNRLGEHFSQFFPSCELYIHFTKCKNLSPQWETFSQLFLQVGKFPHLFTKSGKNLSHNWVSFSHIFHKIGKCFHTFLTQVGNAFPLFHIWFAMNWKSFIQILKSKCAVNGNCFPIAKVNCKL